MEISVIKIGGNVIDHPEKSEEFLTIFAKFPGHKVLIHGGGVLASRMGKTLGIEPNMINGRRITDKATLDVVTMTYAGLINKNIVARLQSMGENAMGLSGADGNAIQSVKRPVKEIDYGYVGDVKKVNADLLEALLKIGVTPVFCAVTHDKKGQLLNTNADTIASEVATALAKNHVVNLYFCFDRAGVLMDEKNEASLIPLINEDIYSELIRENVIHSGMIPKLDNAFAALRAGVARIRIGDLAALAEGRATVVELERE